MKALSSTFILYLMLSIDTSAQSLRTTVKRIENLRNAEFIEVVKSKFSFQDDFSIDTLFSQVLRSTNEPQIGGYYKIKGKNDLYIFNGKKAFWFNFRDKTYKTTNNAIEDQNTRSILYWYKEFQKYLKKPFKVELLADTAISGINYTHFFVKSLDETRKKNHLYNFTSIVVDKKSHLPIVIKSDSRGFSDDGAIMEYMEKHHFENYKVDKKVFPNLKFAAIPAGFKQEEKTKKPIPLPIGSHVPNIELSDLSKRPFDNKRLNGKIILLNFSLLGCPHCVNSVQMLNRLGSKFKNMDFEIISIYQLKFDNQRLISRFDKQFDVQYPSFITKNDVEYMYHFKGYPNFFLVDRQGNLVQHYDGFFASLEKKITDQINNIK